jgi:D-alanine-D-alanine ligase
MKATFAARGLPQGGYLAVHRSLGARSRRRARRADRRAARTVVHQAGPAGLVDRDQQGPLLDALDEAMDEAFTFDEVALIEQGLEHARELEAGVLGDGELDVSQPGEIVPSNEFYDFDAKYLAASDLRIPADVPTEIADRIDELAREAYRAIGCRGLARVDCSSGPTASC